MFIHLCPEKPQVLLITPILPDDHSQVLIDRSLKLFMLLLVLFYMLLNWFIHLTLSSAALCANTACITIFEKVLGILSIMAIVSCCLSGDNIKISFTVFSKIASASISSCDGIECSFISQLLAQI